MAYPPVFQPVMFGDLFFLLKHIQGGSEFFMHEAGRLIFGKASLSTVSRRNARNEWRVLCFVVLSRQPIVSACNYLDWI